MRNETPLQALRRITAANVAAGGAIHEVRAEGSEFPETPCQECGEHADGAGGFCLPCQHGGQLPEPSTRTFKTGDEVKAFDPRTLGVVKHGRIVKVGRKWATVDFGLTGTARVSLRDILDYA